MPHEFSHSHLESPIKHSPGGEMPETSRQARLLKRIQADASVLRLSIFQGSRIYWILGAFASLLLGGYLLSLRKKL